ncbi:MAG TPA: alpha/beta family hydrolase [Mycobacteriales bacterium]|jgi:hypothetical protein|nr:alpha/beta family hydrolase [Mycobacteriales bacterium]
MAVTSRQLVNTVGGPAGVYVDGAGPARLVLGHGAGGGVDAPDLLAARAAALELGLQVVRVEQPWRVRGARVAEAPTRLDAAWLTVLAQLPPLPAVLGGRSSGARVACRTAGRLDDVLGVLCLAFPLVPPTGRRLSRAHELALPHVPRLVVQGSRDEFGVPVAAPGVEVAVVAGADHGFGVRRRDGRTAADVRGQVQERVQDWLGRLLADPPQTVTYSVGDAAQTLT